MNMDDLEKHVQKHGVEHLQVLAEVLKLLKGKPNLHTVRPAVKCLHSHCGDCQDCNREVSMRLRMVKGTLIVGSCSNLYDQSLTIDIISKISFDSDQ